MVTLYILRQTTFIGREVMADTTAAADAEHAATAPAGFLLAVNSFIDDDLIHFGVITYYSVSVKKQKSRGSEKEEQEHEKESSLPIRVASHKQQQKQI